jgi:hypothetical protein
VSYCERNLTCTGLLLFAGKVDPTPHTSSFNMGYLVSPYPYPNGTAGPIPVSMVSTMMTQPGELVSAFREEGFRLKARRIQSACYLMPLHFSCPVTGTVLWIGLWDTPVLPPQAVKSPLPAIVFFTMILSPGVKCKSSPLVLPSRMFFFFYLCCIQAGGGQCTCGQRS